MLLWFSILGGVLSASTYEFGDIIKHGEVKENNIVNIVSSGFPEGTTMNGLTNGPFYFFPKLKSIDESNEHYQTLNSLLRQGVCLKGLTFNIYDDKMREAAVALFRLFQIADEYDHMTLDNWTKIYFHKEMAEYVLRLKSLYGTKFNYKDYLFPPFILKPHYFVNSEAIAKVTQIYNDIWTRKILDSQFSEIYQYYYTTLSSPNYITINANYSGWNLPKNSMEDELNYFMEDVFLNSYYLGIHLLHPFWMSNDELDQINPRHAEHFYYAHKRLMSRYELEKLHLKNKTTTRSDDYYVPYLSYKNGLPFPTRSRIRRNWDDEQSFLLKIDIALKECISRGVIFMENGTTIAMTEDNYIDVLARLIRGNLDSIKTSKIIRNVFGYGDNRFPVDEYYNPAPSLLHHPETSLRDPVYWYLIQYMLNYFSDYVQTMEPYDLSEYEDEDIIIGDIDYEQIYTYFAYHSFPIDEATFLKRSIDPSDRSSKLPARINVMQKKIKHNSFSLHFYVKSKCSDARKVVVRLYLGPECGDNCTSEYSKFFELDTFEYTLQKGYNEIDWSPESLEKKPLQPEIDSPYYKPDTESFNIFKFPDTLLIPRGLEEGLSVTLFIMITPVDNSTIPLVPCQYNEILPQFDSKPLGFPFHRQAKEFNDFAANYRFYNITIYHKKIYVPGKGYFSPHLY